MSLHLFGVLGVEVYVYEDLLVHVAEVEEEKQLLLADGVLDFLEVD